MSAVFESLPGIEVPVDKIKKNLARMWEDTAKAGGAAPGANDAKATQMNFVLHFGFATTAEDARTQFQTILRFSQRYPSRVVVLCPLAEKDRPSTEYRAKVYGECFLGKSKGDTRCVEFVMLSYPLTARQFLEDQVSVCLSTDLPLYYWAHRFSESSRLADYQYLLRSSKRVIFDTGIVSPDAATYPWPRPESVRDLVFARLLPARQSLGQFLSGCAPRMLIDGLVTVDVAHSANRAAEARVLREWLLGRLQACGCANPSGGGTAPDAALPDGLRVQFRYEQPEKQFVWTGDLVRSHAEIESTLTGPKLGLSAAISLLAPEAALAEAVFF